MMLEVTYQEVKGLAMLGVETALEAVKNHDIAERRLRNHLDAMLGHISYIEKNGLSDELTIGSLVDMQEKAQTLATHDKVRLMFGQYNEPFLEECSAIAHRCEFIINHKHSEEVMEGYYEMYINDIAKSLEFIANEVELAFGD